MSKWNRKAELEEKRLPTTVGKTENFATRNVKLITFIICNPLSCLLIGRVFLRLL